MKAVRTQMSMAIMLLALGFSLPSLAWSRPLELTHWWRAPGEQSALNVIQKQAQKNGVDIVMSPQAGYGVLREYVTNRITAGFPPAMTHWIAGKDLKIISAYGALQALPESIQGQPLRDILSAEVYQQILLEGQAMALPVGVHIQNTTYYHDRIFTELNLPIPSSWSELLDMAPSIAKSGVTPAALSNQAAQLLVTLHSIMVDIAGSEGFLKLYDMQHPFAESKASLQKALTLLRRFKPYADPDHADRGWADTVSYFAKGLAATHTLGDYAKSELIAQGYRPGIDFQCRLSPGNSPNMIFEVDVFVLLKQTEASAIEAQAQLAESILAPETQIGYNRFKGGLPVRNDLPSASLDPCAKAKYKLWQSDRGVRMPIVGGQDNLRIWALKYLTKSVWDDDQLDIDQALDEMFEGFEG